MFHDWYADYCRMIAPLSPEEEWQYLDRGETDVLAALAKAQHTLDAYMAALRRPYHISQQSLEWLLREMGHLRTRLAQPTVPVSVGAAGHHLLSTFEAFLHRDAARIAQRFQEEVAYDVDKYLATWQRFVTQGLEGKWANAWQSYWDARTNAVFYCDSTTEEDYAQFLERIRRDPDIYVAENFWDYVSVLGTRDALATLLQLAEGYCESQTAQTVLYTADRRLQSCLVPYDKLLPTAAKPYYPPDYFWWYYQIPQGLYLYDNPHDEP